MRLGKQKSLNGDIIHSLSKEQCKQNDAIYTWERLMRKKWEKKILLRTCFWFLGF